jgi:hypothetical protein
MFFRLDVPRARVSKFQGFSSAKIFMFLSADFCMVAVVVLTVLVVGAFV